MQVLKKKVRFTYQDYLHIPGDKRYEIIEGDLHMVPAPLTYHQKISRSLEYYLWDFVAKNDLGEVLDAPVDVLLTNEDVVQPDLLFISKDRLTILTEKNVCGAPDLVVEILSPSSREWDREFKKRLYEKHGVLEYWIADPDAKAVEVYTFTEDGFQLVQSYPRTSTLSSPLLKGLKIPLEKVF